MDIRKEKEKQYIQEIFEEIGTWSGKVEEHYYKNGEEIPAGDDSDGTSKKTVYLEGTEKKFEIQSNGGDTIVLEYEDGTEVEKFIIKEDEMFALLGIED